MATLSGAEALGWADETTLKEAALKEPGTAGVDLVAGLDPCSPTVVVDTQTGGDDRHPGVEASIAREAGERLVRLGEGLLGDLLGLSAVADAALAERAETVEVERVEVVEGRRIAGLPCLDQGSVTSQIDLLSAYRHPPVTPR